MAFVIRADGLYTARRWTSLGVVSSRKNWLFAGSPKGARASACAYSLVETAKANDLDPFLYIRTLLEDIPGSDYRTNPEIMERLMPWSDYMQSACAASQKR